MDYITDLDLLKKLFQDKLCENIEFRIFLKMQDLEKIDKLVKKYDPIVKNAIDCVECGNCCHILEIPIVDSDIARISQLEDIAPEDFKEKYTKIDPEDGLNYMIKTPCRYLDGNFCTIYTDRMMACRAFPYTKLPNFTSRSLMMFSNAEMCPIVYNLLEELKRATNFEPEGI